MKADIKCKHVNHYFSCEEECMNTIFSLKPNLKEKVWGGTKLADRYNKAKPGTNIGESWEISAHTDGEATIENGEFAGKTLLEASQEKPEILGSYPKQLGYFPILTKFIDATRALSVQVHPKDDYARKYEHDNGKTEMWFIIDSEPGAKIYLGPKEELNKEEILESLEAGTFIDLLRGFEVKPGDCFYVPAGTIHAIGAGCLVYEVQQSSNVTYRLYDYKRPDKDGNLRELHVDKSLDVLDPKPVDEKFVSLEKDRLSGEEKLFHGKNFQVDLVYLEGERDLSVGAESFLALTLLKGSASAHRDKDSVNLVAGKSIFAPAGDKDLTLYGNGLAIVTRVKANDAQV